MNETINGLLSVKPGNEPQQGETRTFVIEHRPARNGKKAWIKVKGAGENYGGSPFRILSAEPTGFTDAYGNISFNVELEATTNGGDATFTNTLEDAPATSVPLSNAAPTSKPEGAANTKEGYWERKERRDLEKEPMIMRQHSQEMALRFFALSPDPKPPTTKQLRGMISWFQRDISRPPEKEPAEVTKRTRRISLLT